ncbi:UNVERIFIED_CONTAM: hypothetical protein Sradi_2980700 [Sesamum radiatum]|uniref:Uncharacterized protein n=1 Tax=Sesamum radiatum TaxID=300843 RepID=A0AAW2S1A2_SESRA
MGKTMQCVQRVLEKLEKVLGLQIILEKSLVVFSHNIPCACKVELSNILGVRVVDRQKKYLGLLTVVGRSKNAIFQHLTNKVWIKLQSWKCKNLSQAGKVVLLKSVVQPIPVFLMSCFQVPLLVCREIEGLMVDFLWHNKGLRKNSLASLGKGLSSKQMGGLGLRKISDPKQAMLLKQFWRMIINPNSLISHIWTQKYFPTFKLHKARAVVGCSFTWRSILAL